MQNIAVVGTGVIGIGWIARFLSRGYDVCATDPDPLAEEKVYKAIEKVWPTLQQSGLAEDASINRLHFSTSMEDAVRNADFIQENVPEREALKRKVLSEIDHFSKPDAIIASSTSGIKPSILQNDCDNPERVIVAHPFNPVYLMPLVEVIRGEKTGQATIKTAQQLYQSIGMKPLVISHEIEGHIADRLMEAVWRESLHLVNDGIATTEEIDASLVYGPGLRWALMGPFLTMHMAGGDEGMRHMLEQFGPALKLPWTKLEAPELTKTLEDKVISGSEQQADGLSMTELEERRDQFLLELLQLLEKYWPSANLNGSM